MEEVKNNKYKKLTINTILFAIGSFGPKLLTFLLVPLYTSKLTTVEYGIGDLISTTVILFTYVFTLNISDAVFRFGLDKERQNKIGLFFYGLFIIISGLVVVVGISLLLRFFNVGGYPNYTYYFLIINYIGIAIFNLCTSYVQSIDKVLHSAIAGILYTAVSLTSNIILLLVFDKGLFGYLISNSIGYVLAILYLLIIIRPSPKKYLSNRCDKETAREMLKYSVPLIFNNVSWWINSSSDKYLIEYLLPSGSTGIYAISQKIPSIITIIQSIFLQAWGISVIQELKDDDCDSFFSNTFDMFVAATFIAGSMLLFLNIPLAHMLYKNEFYEAWQYSSILVLSSCFSGLAGFVGTIFSAKKKTNMYAVSVVIPVIINIALNILLIYYIGLIGAAIATLISYFAMYIMRLILTKRIIKWKTHTVRDGLAILVISGQVVFEHFLSSYFYFEFLFFIVILIIYFKQIKKIVLSIIRKIRNKDKAEVV